MLTGLEAICLSTLRSVALRTECALQRHVHSRGTWTVQSATYGTLFPQHGISVLQDVLEFSAMDLQMFADFVQQCSCIP